MADYEEYEDDDDFELGPSKTQRKKEMHALQALGEQLASLSEKQLEQIPVDDERLLRAIRETRNIKSNNALRRHRQYIGKLMRDIDPAPIEAALEQLFRPSREANARFHRLEQLRDDVLGAGDQGVAKVLAQYPDADRQQLRHLLLQHRRERERDQPPAAARKLFRYLRELDEAQGEG
ncbi:ribosome biogenesis factor YjgA [Haliea sp. E17]|uniref:ribosome biogenesis factor YjgA n=1 Tax=Haliea sp. E17 TaxID=3401576 RepID=UPI003AB072FA